MKHRGQVHNPCTGATSHFCGGTPGPEMARDSASKEACRSLPELCVLVLYPFPSRDVCVSKSSTPESGCSSRRMGVRGPQRGRIEGGCVRS